MTGVGHQPAAGGLSAPPPRGGGLAADQFTLAGRDFTLLRPRDPDAVLDEVIASGEEDDDRLPFWAELWPSGIALARAVVTLRLTGSRVLELGCGLGLVSVAAAASGADVLAADRAPEAIRLTEINAVNNRVKVRTVQCAFDEPDPLLAEAPWDLVLAADVLYEPRNVPVLLWLLPRLVGATGEIWLADPGRNQTGGFLTGVDATGWHRDQIPTAAADQPRVTIHRLRRA